MMFIGRILSRLSKDQDTLDNELSMILMQVRSTDTNENYVNIYLYHVVPADSQLSPGNGCAGFLYFPFAGNHLCSAYYPLLFGRCVLPPILCRNETDRLSHAIDPVWLLFRQVKSHSNENKCRLRIHRNHDWPYHYSSISPRGETFFLIYCLCSEL